MSLLTLTSCPSELLVMICNNLDFRCYNDLLLTCSYMYSHKHFYEDKLLEWHNKKCPIHVVPKEAFEYNMGCGGDGYCPEQPWSYKIFTNPNSNYYFNNQHDDQLLRPYFDQHLKNMLQVNDIVKL